MEEGPEGAEVERLVSERIANPSIQNLNAFLVSKLSAKDDEKGKGKGKAQVSAAGPNLRAISQPSDAIQRRAEPYLKQLVALVGNPKAKAEAGGSGGKVKKEGEDPVKKEGK